MLENFNGYEKLRNLIFLTKLSINCTEITNDQVGLFVKYLPNLKGLNLMGCKNLTFSSVRGFYEFSNILKIVDMRRIEIIGFQVGAWDRLTKDRESLEVMVDEYHLSLPDMHHEVEN